MPAVLSVTDLSFRYPDYPALPSRSLFEGLDLEMEAGSCVRILGDPEAGKSTLARILCGLVPRYTGGEAGGRILIQGIDARLSRPCDLIEHVGIVFQNPDEQIVTSRCSSEVAFPLESLGVDPEEMPDRIARALAWVGLEGYAEREPLTLSGGEKRRLLMACLHAVRPALWILDETIEEIDAAVRERLVRDLRRAETSLLLFASREVGLEGSSPDRTFLLVNGRLEPAAAAQGPAAPRRRLLRRSTGAACPLLSLRGVEYAYPGGSGFRLSVRELSLAEGEIVALAGPNGAGKSTLGRILCGLEVPRSGEILLAVGGSYSPAAPELLRSTVAYVFQNPDYQLFLPTVGEELEYGLRERGASTHDVDARISQAIELFDLPDVRAPSTLLSHGARKRMQMAVYYLLSRRLVILDEADAGLTSESFVSAVDAFAAKGSAVLVISHDAKLVGTIAERTVLMEQGTIAC